MSPVFRFSNKTHPMSALLSPSPQLPLRVECPMRATLSETTTWCPCPPWRLAATEPGPPRKLQNPWKVHGGLEYTIYFMDDNRQIMIIFIMNIFMNWCIFMIRFFCLLYMFIVSDITTISPLVHDLVIRCIPCKECEGILTIAKWRHEGIDQLLVPSEMACFKATYDQFFWGLVLL